MRRKEGLIVRYEVGNNNMRMMMTSVMKNNNLSYEYAANSVTTTINHYML